MRDPSQSGSYDAVVVGSGFGGVMAAHELVGSGRRVLMLERGGWMPREGAARDPVWGFFQLTDAYVRDGGYSVVHGGRRADEGICACVGGPSVFYGGASFRFREADFTGAPEVVGASGAEWPIGYAEMEAHYARAEALLSVAGEAGVDPTEPWRSGPFPRGARALAPVSERIEAGARRLGLQPFRVPLAVGDGCAEHTVCDGYACGVGGKHDLATTVLPGLLERGLELRPRTAAVRLVAGSGRVTGVECVDLDRGERFTVSADRVVLAAGALASPHLVLASGLERLNPGGHTVGRHLMRHCNAFVYGFFRRAPNPEGLHHKQVAIHDFYFGDDAGGAPAGKLGNLQQIMHPQVGGILRSPARALGRAGRAGRWVTGGLASLAGGAARHLTGLQVIAEDQPREVNRLVVDPGRRDALGLPRATIEHAYTARDLAARAALVRRAREILLAGGADFIAHVHEVSTFSHAVGTLRMGRDPATSALDEWCRFRGLDNLYVLDGSFMPTSAGVNPSLTIAANALRVGAHLAHEP